MYMMFSNGKLIYCVFVYSVGVSGCRCVWICVIVCDCVCVCAHRTAPHLTMQLPTSHSSY